MQERQTRQKRVIYDALKALDHPTATEVYGYVHERYPSISRATVFRVLGGFAASGRALELADGGRGRAVRLQRNAALSRPLPAVRAGDGYSGGRRPAPALPLGGARVSRGGFHGGIFRNLSRLPRRGENFLTGKKAAGDKKEGRERGLEPLFPPFSFLRGRKSCFSGGFMIR